MLEWNRRTCLRDFPNANCFKNGQTKNENLNPLSQFVDRSSGGGQGAYDNVTGEILNSITPISGANAD
jgi:hypothetical protein